MDKPTSIIASFRAGKLPSTQQFNRFVEYLYELGFFPASSATAAATTAAAAKDEEVEPLSEKGKILSDDLKASLDSFRTFLNGKNGDNILQDALWHLSKTNINETKTTLTSSTLSKSKADIQQIHQSLLTLLTSLFHSLTSSSQTKTSSSSSLLSYLRTSLSDILEQVEDKASSTKSHLRTVQGEIQAGKRDPYGFDKATTTVSEDPTTIAWEQGVESLKGAGTILIGGVQSVEGKMEDTSEKVQEEVKAGYYSVWKRARADPEYRQALDTIFSILQKWLQSTKNTTTSASDITLSSIFEDPTPDQDLSKSLALLRRFIERVGNKSLDPFVSTLQHAILQVIQDDKLGGWFDEFFNYARRSLEDVDYAPTSEAKERRKRLRAEWKTLSENRKWFEMVEKVKEEWTLFEKGVEEDEDWKGLVEGQKRLGEDLKKLVGEEGGWMWQDLFKVYLPNLLGKLKAIPIPRTEYKDEEIEFVLENLDVSQVKLLPSRVYIRNITDISVETSEEGGGERQMGTATHIRIEALQLELDDVSFWYKSKVGSAMVPSEFTGLLGVHLPTKGMSVDVKVRLIPAKAKGKQSRAEQRRTHVIERCVVEISDEVEVEVRESNHPMLVSVFSGVVKRRIKEALERTVSGEIRGLIEWVDGLWFDVSDRRKVFEDAGLGGSAAVLGALLSELGKLEREAEGREVGAKVTGSGLIFEEKTDVPVLSGSGMFEYEVGKESKERVLAFGAGSQVLGPEKRGPLGSGVKGRVEGFAKAVKRKQKEESLDAVHTWKTDAFDL